MTDQNRKSLDLWIQGLQLFMLVVGVAAVFTHLGSRDRQLEQNTDEIVQLRAIATDLLKQSVETVSTNRNQDRRLDDLRSRLDRLETSDR